MGYGDGVGRWDMRMEYGDGMSIGMEMGMGMGMGMGMEYGDRVWTWDREMG